MYSTEKTRSVSKEPAFLVKGTKLSEECGTAQLVLISQPEKMAEQSACENQTWVL